MHEDIVVLYIENLTMDWKTIKAFGMCITYLKNLVSMLSGLAIFGIY